jgi:hypothetical protein
MDFQSSVRNYCYTKQFSPTIIIMCNIALWFSVRQRSRNLKEKRWLTEPLQMTLFWCLKLGCFRMPVERVD